MVTLLVPNLCYISCRDFHRRFSSLSLQYRRISFWESCDTQEQVTFFDQALSTIFDLRQRTDDPSPPLTLQYGYPSLFLERPRADSWRDLLTTDCKHFASKRQTRTLRQSSCSAIRIIIQIQTCRSSKEGSPTTRTSATSAKCKNQSWSTKGGYGPPGPPGPP